MEWTILLPKLLEAVLIPLLGWLTAELIRFFKSKIALAKASTNNEILQKYLTMLDDTVTTCVQTTNQTYVDALKKAGSFDKAAQEQAFQQTYQAVLGILADEAKEYLTEAVGDFEALLKNKIEASVKENKG